jgi:hypothetical protein
VSAGRSAARAAAPRARRARPAAFVSLAACAAAAALALPGAAQARVRTVEPVRAFAKQVAGIRRHTRLAVLLPDRARVEVPAGHGIEAKWAANRTSWSLALGIGPRCGGANACFVGQFVATQGGRLTFRSRVRLHGGVIGRYKPSTCGASCSPPEIQWKVRDVLYDVQFRAAGPGSDKQKLVTLADSALAAGPR